MRKLLVGLLVIGVVGIWTAPGCGSSTGPRIEVGQNVRNLCNYTLSGVREEDRCANDQACPQIDEFCWQPDPQGIACASHADCGQGDVCHGGFCYPGCEVDANCALLEGNLKCLANGDVDATRSCRTHGYCRQCGSDGQCDLGKRCDGGWCRSECSADSDCDPGQLCTGGVCRPPHATDFDLCNVGDRNLEIYPGRTVVRGDADGAVFCDLEWDSAADPIVLAPEDCAMLRVRFRPTVLGEFRAWIDIESSDDTLSPLPLLMCGQAVSQECMVAYDGSCSNCQDYCGEDDFAGYSTKASVCQ